MSKDFNSLNSYIGPPGTGGGVEYPTLGDARRDAPIGGEVRVTQDLDVANNALAIDWTSTKVSATHFSDNPFEEHRWLPGNIDDHISGIGGTSMLQTRDPLTAHVLNVAKTLTSTWTVADASSGREASASVGIDIDYTMVSVQYADTVLKEFPSPISTSYGVRFGVSKASDDTRWASCNIGGGTNPAINAYGAYPTTWNAFSVKSSHLNQPVTVSVHMAYVPNATTYSIAGHRTGSGSDTQVLAAAPTTYRDDYANGEPMIMFFTQLNGSGAAAFTVTYQTFGGVIKGAGFERSPTPV